jgi:hypothetical protein
VSSKNIGPITDCDITYQLPTFWSYSSVFIISWSLKTKHM